RLDALELEAVLAAEARDRPVEGPRPESHQALAGNGADHAFVAHLPADADGPQLVEVVRRLPVGPGDGPLRVDLRLRGLLRDLGAHRVGRRGRAGRRRLVKARS